MTKKFAAIAVAMIFAVPVSASAQTVTNDQLIVLYTQLVQLLQQQVMLLSQNPITSGNLDLAITPVSGSAPLPVSFRVLNGQGTEAIDFGDGGSSVPGSYTVTLYSSSSGTPVAVKTFIISVSGISAQ
jgi:PKD repeat protein